MTDCQLVRYLLRAPLHPKVELHFGPHPGPYVLSIAAALGAFGRFHACLFSSVATISPRPRLTLQLIVLQLLPKTWEIYVSVYLAFMGLKSLYRFSRLRCLYTEQLQLGA